MAVMLMRIIPIMILTKNESNRGGGDVLESFFLFCLSAQRSVMAMILVVPLPHYEKNLKSEKKIVGVTRATFPGLAQKFMARPAVARHFGNPPPPPQQTPWRRPWLESPPPPPPLRSATFSGCWRSSSDSFCHP